MTHEQLIAAGYVLTEDGSYRKPSLHERDFDNRGDSPREEEQQDADNEGPAGQAPPPPDADNEAGVPAGIGEDHGVFAVSVVVRLPDRRRRDLDGIFSSILDCLVTTRRRLLDTHSDTEDSRRTVRSRRRRSYHHHTKAVGKVPF